MTFMAIAANPTPLLLTAWNRTKYCPLTPNGMVPLTVPLVGLKTRPGGSPSAAIHRGALLAPIPVRVGIVRPAAGLVLVYCKTWAVFVQAGLGLVSAIKLGLLESPGTPGPPLTVTGRSVIARKELELLLAKLRLNPGERPLLVIRSEIGWL